MTDELGWLAAAGAIEPVAELHGTVDLERALVERGLEPGLAHGALADSLIGARLVVLGTPPDAVALAEPSIEGRLAASLARHDEGVHGAYVQAPVPLAEVARRAAAAGVVLSRPADGPFGREVLVVRARNGGRHLLLVEPPAVPSPG